MAIGYTAVAVTAQTADAFSEGSGRYYSLQPLFHKCCCFTGKWATLSEPRGDFRLGVRCPRK